MARDAFGFTLNYFNGIYDGGTTLYHDGDYTPVTPATATFAAAVTGTGGAFDTHGKDLFNGNIRYTTLQLKGVDTIPVAYAYRYDQLQRLKETTFFNASINASTYSLNNATTASGDYHEDYSYDGNGNILTLNRRGYLSSGQDEMDSLVYFYDSGKNRLNYIRDTVPAGNYNVDLDSQTPNNYSYDESGNLISDVREKLSAVTWSPYGKIKNIAKSLDTVNIAYSYDASMNRVLKKYTSASDTVKTYYIRDAQGNVLAVYTIDNDSLRWTEQNLFGSSRLGLIEKNILLNSSTVNVNKPGTPGLVMSVKRNERRYELTNHLGNVLSVISDVKRPKSESSNTYYDVDRIAVNDYYPFGMQMPGRKQSLDIYRFGFNGKENDNEVKGEGNQQDYGMRMYDPRVGRWLSVDPMEDMRNWLSPYQFVQNSPVWRVDPDGALDTDFINSSTGEHIYANDGFDRISFVANPIDWWKISIMSTSKSWDKKSTTEYFRIAEEGSLNLNSDLGLLTRLAFTEFTNQGVDAKMIAAESVLNRIDYFKKGGVYADKNSPDLMVTNVKQAIFAKNKKGIYTYAETPTHLKFNDSYKFVKNEEIRNPLSSIRAELAESAYASYLVYHNPNLRTGIHYYNSLPKGNGLYKDWYSNTQGDMQLLTLNIKGVTGAAKLLK